MNLPRREFLRLLAVGGAALMVNAGLSPPSAGPVAYTPRSTPTSFVPNLWLRVGADDGVTIVIPRSEMGQGVRTGLAMIVAEELDARWATVRVEQAPGDPRYGDQLTGSSASIRKLWDTARTAGATARELLRAAAARTWGVQADDCRTADGRVIHPASGREVPYGQLVAFAGTLSLPTAGRVRLKEPGEFRLIGTRLPRVDGQDIVTGRAIYGLDVRVPGMLHVVIARCPVFGGTLASLDDTAARAVPGVRRVIRLDNAVAVVGETTWAALQGREALAIRWDAGKHADLDDAAIRALFEREAGQVPDVATGAARAVAAVYEVPFLAHAPLEPMNCVADMREDRCEVWAPTQHPLDARRAVARVAKLPDTAVTLHVTLMGGGFGRRVASDFVEEAARVARAVGAPVKLLWTRDDDLRHDFYRPASRHLLRGGVDAAGQPTRWAHRVVTARLSAGSSEREMLAGARHVPYAVPSPAADVVALELPVPTGWWRSVFHSQNVFATECFLDELAAAGGRDPYQLRRALATEHRLRAVLDLAAERAGWGTPLPPGQGRGIACFAGYQSFVAQVAEVAVAADGTVRVGRVVCAVDCGVVVNPSLVEAQIEGAIADGAGMALQTAITIERGGVRESSFRDYRLTRLPDMPLVEVHLVPSAAPPGGVGELGLPPTAAAIANAIHAATGRRIRRLPIRPADLR